MIRIVHLLSEPDSPREQRSISEVSALAEYGFEYIRVVNPPYDGSMPPAREATDRGFDLTCRHWACYCAHKSALQCLTSDMDALLICEGDCVFVEPPGKIAERIKKAYEACIAYSIPVFTFGYKHDGKVVAKHEYTMCISQLIETHCLLLPRAFKDDIVDLFTLPWDAADYIYTVYGFDQRGLRIGTFSDRPVAVQASGPSLIDGREKTSEQTYRDTRYK